MRDVHLGGPEDFAAKPQVPTDLAADMQVTISGQSLVSPCCDLGDSYEGVNPLDVVYEIVAGICSRGLAVGDVVAISGLQQAVGLNGREGRIVSVLADGTRFGVELGGKDPDRKSISASNLLVLSEAWADTADVVVTAAKWDLS